MDNIEYKFGLNTLGQKDFCYIYLSATISNKK